MITLSSKEIVEHGKSLVMYKLSSMPGKKCLIPVYNFEKAIEVEKVIRQAVNWKIFNFTIKRIQESWDSFYYKICLNGDFLNTATNLDDAKETANSIVKKLQIKVFTVIVLSD